MNTNDFALLDDDVLLSCKRKLQTSGIFKISLALLMIVCLFGKKFEEKMSPWISMCDNFCFISVFFVRNKLK